MANKDKAGEKADVTGGAQSQAQQASGEPAQEQQAPEDAAGAGSAGGTDAGIQFFEGTVVKIDREGREVMSDHLAPGETLRRATSDRHTTYAHHEQDSNRRNAGN